MENPSYRLGKSYEGLFRGTITDPFVLLEGRRGTAKTATILKILTYRAFRWPGTRFLIARSTRARLSESVIQTFDNHVLPSFGLKPPAASASHRTGYDFPTIQGKRSRFIFMALDDPGRSQSVEADGAYISECTELSSIEDATTLTGAIRQRMDAIQEGSKVAADPFPGLTRQIILDANPAHPGHWANKAAEPAGDELRVISNEADYLRTVAFNLAPSQGGWKRIITSLPDNPGYWDRDAWKPTDACQRYLDGLGYMPPYMRERWIQGRWVAAEGGVFPEFTVERNVCKPFKVPAAWPVWLLIDPGYDHPCGVTWNTVAPNGTKYTIDEIKVRQTGIPELARMIFDRQRAVTGIYIDPAGTQKRQESPLSFQRQLELQGLRSQLWPRASKEDHDASVAAHRESIVNGRYKVFSSCACTIDEHQSWKYKRNSSGEMLSGDDQYEDANNDILDGILGWERTKPGFTIPQITEIRPDSLPQRHRQESI